MATKTLRPLKRGDKCWIRIQRKGKPVLAVYDETTSSGGRIHLVKVGGQDIYATHYRHLAYDADEAIFVAKPIPEDA